MGYRVNIEIKPPLHGEAIAKFVNPDWTAKGEPRARVALTKLETLWFNTGTLCNITCVNCYIESSPKNDRLVYITASEVAGVLDDVAREGYGTREIGFTGGEPFLNPDMVAMADVALTRGFSVLILTNAMQPMQRPKVVAGLLDLKRRFADQLTLRVSLDHYTRELHETERGQDTWDKVLAGLGWLSAEGFNIAIAGRTCWGESDDAARQGYARLISDRGWAIDAADPTRLMLFPEMDGKVDVPEISTSCWKILDKHPSQMMCATSRMIAKRKGADSLTVLPCTLLPYDQRFDMGETLVQSMAASGGMFEAGAVKLCHQHCAKFCVLGGGSCS